MRRFLVALLTVLLGLPLVAAVPGASLLPAPTLVVYPLTNNGGSLNKEAGSRLAIAIANQIANLGGVNVKPAPPGIDRKAYLDTARTEGADYYIAGFVTPVGDNVSVVEQLVTTQTGIVVFSSTAQIQTLADAAGQGDILREALLRHQSRNLGSYATQPPPAPSPSPAASPGANLGKLFGRHKKAAPPASSATATPVSSKVAASSATKAARAVAQAPVPASTPAPVVAALPTSGYGILPFGGSANTERRQYVAAAIVNLAAQRHARTADISTAAASTGIAQAARNLCVNANVGTLLGGNLTTSNRTILGATQTEASLELLAYDCNGNVVYRQTFAKDAVGDWKNAVNRVVQTALGTYLKPAAPRGG